MTLRRMLAAVTLVFAVTASGLLLAPAQPAQAATYNWGAIAYNNHGGTVGAWNYRSGPAAQRAVMNRCGPNCGFFTFYNSCGAVAYSNGGRYVAWARGYRTATGARRAALRKLHLPGHVARWVCTAR